MATLNFETLRARVQALGCQLFIDNADDGDPRMYIHDPKVDKHVIVGVQADEIVDWIETEEDVRNDTREVLASDSPTTERDGQATRGIVPAEGTKAGETQDDDEPTAKELLGQCWHHMHAVERIAAMLYDDGDQTEEAYGAAHAIKHLAGTAYQLIDTAKARMGVSVTPAVIAMSERLNKLGYKLLADATAADIFSVVRVRPGPELTWVLFIVSLYEIEAWLEREVLKGGAA